MLGFCRGYSGNTQENSSFNAVVTEAAGEQRFPDEAYIKVRIQAFYEVPKSCSKVRRTAMLNGELLPAKKPDIDNVVKAVLDALNKVAYRDDNQVVELKIRKQYSERPRLEICNERLEEFLSFEKGKDQEGRSKEYFAYQMFAGH